MAMISGQRITYGYDNTATTYDGANEALDISGALATLDPFHHPLLNALGYDGATVEQVKHEWLEDEVAGLSATSTDTDLNNTSTGSVVLTLATAGDYLKFRGGTVASASADIVRISSTAGQELVWVTATASNTVTCLRGAFSGSSPVDHTGYTKTLTIVGRFQPQGLTTVGASITTLKANKYNYTQIYEDSYSASATQQSTRKWTMQDDRAYEFGKMLKKAAVLFERTWIEGFRTAPSSSSGGTAAGLKATISTNSYDKSGAALTQTILEDALDDMFQNGADGSYLALVNSTQQRRINTFLDGYRQASYTDTNLGNFVTRFTTRFGTLDLMLDKNVLQNEVIIVTKSNCKMGWLRPLGQTPIAPTSREAQTWEVTGEFTFETRLEKTHAWIKNLATTGLY